MRRHRRQGRESMVGMAEDGVSSAEAMLRAKEHPEQTPAEVRELSSCEWAHYLR